MLSLKGYLRNKTQPFTKASHALLLVKGGGCEDEKKNVLSSLAFRRYFMACYAEKTVGTKILIWTHASFQG